MKADALVFIVKRRCWNEKDKNTRNYLEKWDEMVMIMPRWWYFATRVCCVSCRLCPFLWLILICVMMIAVVATLEKRNVMHEISSSHYAYPNKEMVQANMKSISKWNRLYAIYTNTTFCLEKNIKKCLFLLW